MPQMMTILKPPTWFELMDDDVYRAYARKRPRLPVNVSYGTPWVIVARRPENSSRPTWALKMMDDYALAYHRSKTIMATGDYEDIAIVSRRKLFKPPVGLMWDDTRFSWCGRCRRPTMFREMYKHPMMRHFAAVSLDESRRCYYCAAREILAGRFMMRF